MSPVDVEEPADFQSSPRQLVVRVDGSLGLVLTHVDPLSRKLVQRRRRSLQAEFAAATEDHDFGPVLQQLRDVR